MIIERFNMEHAYYSQIVNSVVIVEHSSVKTSSDKYVRCVIPRLCYIP